MQQNEMNISKMNVNDLVEKLSNGYCKLINNNISIKKMPSIMLWGAPGVGKSQAIRQIGKEISEQTNKKVFIQDVRLLLFSPIDLRGIPTKEKDLTVWLKPKIFQMDPSDNVVNILFLDEISAAPASVQAAAYQITLDRKVGEHDLPDNCIVIAAGNRLTDKSVAYKMPKALANRLLHINIVEDFDSWKSWAIKNDIHPMVVGFLSFKNEYLMKFDPSNDDLAYPTPRSWEMVSNILNYINDDIKAVYDFIKGLVGVGTAIEFKTWANVYKDLPKVEDIFDGKNPPLPTQVSTLYALASAIVCYAKKHKDEMDRIENSINYIVKIRPDMCMVIIEDYLCIDKDYRNKLMRIPAFNQLVQKKGKLLNGSN